MMKGALIEFVPAFGRRLPNVVVFQFNPETLRHSWSQPPHAAQSGQPGSNPLAVPGHARRDVLLHASCWT